MFTNTYLPHVSGVARSVYTLTEDLKKMGCQVLVIAPVYTQMETTEKIDNYLLRVPAIQNFNGSDFSIRMPLPFIISQKIDEFQPQIVHSHQPFLLGDTAMRVAYRRDLPLVFTHHTRYEEYTHYVSSRSEIMKRFAANLSTEYANLCDHVVAPSQSLANLLQKRGVNVPVSVLPTGVDTDFFNTGDGKRYRNENNIPELAPLIGYTGRLAPEKNLIFLSESVITVMKNLRSVYFLLVGTGPGAADIKKIFVRHGLGNRLIMPGNHTGQVLADAYSAINLFVFASKTETQGMVMVEAMAAGTPVIAIDAIGVREIVRDRINGRLLPKESSVDDFAGAVMGYLKDGKDQDFLSMNAIKSVQQFKRNICSQKMFHLYNLMINEKNKLDRNPLSDNLEIWEKFLRSIKAEWDMIFEKSAAAIHSIRNSDNWKEK